MTFRSWAAIGLIAILAGCSDTAESDANAAANAASAAEAGESSADLEERLTRSVDCTARMEAVSNMYRAIASQSQDEEQREMIARAEERAEDAAAFRRQSASLAERAGVSSGEVERRVIASARALNAQSDTMPFEQFAAMLGREADRCPRPMV